jgi:hypothetical protein
MQRRLLVPLLAFGVVLSGSALGQVSMRSNVTEPQSQAKMDRPNSHKQETHANTVQAMSSQPGPVTGPILATPGGPVNLDAGD